MSEYVKPQVWAWADQNEKRGGNRPTAGSRFEQVLPRGEQPLQVYSLGTPNGIKVAIMLEELKEAGVANAGYDLFRINISQGDQFGSDFVEINPNSKIPALVDQSGNEDIKVFESAHILLYLAEKYGHFIPENLQDKTEMMNWLFWQTGAAPFVGGGFGHFFHYAPTAQEYPINRYTMETKRQLDLLDQLLATRPYIAGDDYTIADIAIWSWYGRLVEGNLYPGSAAFLDVKSYKYLTEWTEKIAARPAVQRGLAAEYRPI
ncbi:glutathione-dependent disulfide-bond oxidoreductase [Streptococcus marmotae]|uniref:glutathione-dependent disulfide-bond oxidoreductase n=1 Tax=Streptococcus marmotae TaxID=1825069 RepID=UPI00082F3D93|nr:glutathione-dependent disulfide-bond oxidoreductase [Streptococcus marmotae]